MQLFQVIPLADCALYRASEPVTIKMPTARMFHDAVCVHNKLYIFGGYAEEPTYRSRLEGDKRPDPSKRIHCLDLDTLVWEEKKEMPSGLIGITSVVVDDCVYVLANAIKPGERPTMNIALKCYNTVTDEWKNLASPPLCNAHGMASAVYHDGKVFYAAGFGTPGILSVLAPFFGVTGNYQMASYSVEHDLWEVLPSTPPQPADNKESMFVADGKVHYFVVDVYGNKHCWEFSFVKNEWKRSHTKMPENICEVFFLGELEEQVISDWFHY